MDEPGLVLYALQPGCVCVCVCVCVWGGVLQGRWDGRITNDGGVNEREKGRHGEEQLETGRYRDSFNDSDCARQPVSSIMHRS